MSQRSLPCARLPTSDDTLAILEEMKNKKKKAPEDKEKSKQDRAEKKG